MPLTIEEVYGKVLKGKAVIVDGRDILVTSANLSNQISPTNAEHVRKQLGSKIPLIVDGGQCQVGIESTVIDVSVTPPRVLRPGMIHEQALAAVAVDDGALDYRVDAAIKAQPTLKDQDIDVKVTDKVVTLTGYVQTAQRKSTAGRVAKVAGVTKVDNQLMVDPKKGKDMDARMADTAKTAAVKTGEAAKTVGEKTKDAAETVGEKTKDAAVATGDAITDATINTKIHAKMMDETTLKGSDINVDVSNHVVVLKGTVASAAGKARAAEIARTTDGVKSVNNMLVVGPKK
jgi:osmotically-inducible protein OsmY